MKWRLELELRDVYGGDGEVRYEPKEQVKLRRSRTKTTVRESIGLAVDTTTTEKVTEKKMEPINTFRVGEDEEFVLRLGGVHGKLWGLFKDAAKQMWTLGDSDFTKGYKTVVEMLSITPVWVKLPVDGDIRVEGMWQQMASGRTGIELLYDVIPKTNCEVFLEFPDEIEPKVEKLLERIQGMGCLNKRRATIRVKGSEVVG